MNIFKKIYLYRWILLLGLLILGSGEVFQYASYKYKMELKTIIQLAAKREASYLFENLNSRMEFIVNDLLDICHASSPLTQNEHVNLTTHLINANPFLQTINYIGSDHRIKFVSPFEPNKAIIGLKIEIAAPKNALEMAASSGHPCLSKPFEIVQGKIGYSLMIPLSAGDFFEIVFKSELVFGKMSHFRRREYIAMQALDGEIVVSSDSEYSYQAERSIEYEVVEEAELFNRHLYLHVLPTDEMLRMISPFWHTTAIATLVMFFIFLVTFVVMGTFSLKRYKQAEEMLQESEGKYKRLVEGSPDILYMFSNKRGGVYYSKHVESILGYSRDYLYQHPILWNHSIHPEDRTIVRQAIRNFKKEKHFSVEYRIKRADGEWRWLHDRSIGRREMNGEVVIEGLASDITDRKRAEEQLHQYAAELREANAELSQYAYVVSHDLKAPLRAIHNYVGFLREDLESTLENEQKNYLDGLDTAVSEAQSLIDDLLQLSQVGQQEASVETIDVGSFLRSLLSSLNLPDDVEIEMEDDWPTLTTHSVLFRQVFQNLIGNAAKFNRSLHKHIELGWRSVDDEHNEFFVRDNGIGIAPSHHENIFRVFDRLHTKEEFEGSGIGLAIVKKAVIKLQGTIRVESIPGEGSTFFVTLPRT